MMGKYLYLFRIVYLILLLFVFANFLLELFGYAFTPLLWNPWLYLGAVTAFSHIWYRFYRTHTVNWKNVVGLLFSFFASLILVLFIVFFLTQFRSLNVLLMGDEAATTLGLNTNLCRWAYLTISALMVGTLVSSVGTIGFVGLIIPHIARSFVVVV